MGKLYYSGAVYVAAIFLLGAAVQGSDGWQSFITAEQLQAKTGQENLVIVDARSPEEYGVGHISGAVNIPGGEWRTSSAKPGKGDSQYVFRMEDGAPDVAKYEAFLGGNGLNADQQIVIYGNHAGKADGSVPAFILTWLGHQQVAFLDGIGVDEWIRAGFELSTEGTILPASQYVANPLPDYIWDLDKVIAGQGDENVVFIDTRSPAEFAGEDLRGNERAGHIPGAVHIDYEALLDPETRQVLDPGAVSALLASKQVGKDRKIVLYCQTATRTSLHSLALRDLGYPNVSVYDASWHEYGNRKDTPVVTP